MILRGQEPTETDEQYAARAKAHWDKVAEDEKRLLAARAAVEARRPAPAKNVKV